MIGVDTLCEDISSLWRPEAVFKVRGSIRRSDKASTALCAKQDSSIYKIHEDKVMS